MRRPQNSRYPWPQVDPYQRGSIDATADLFWDPMRPGPGETEIPYTDNERRRLYLAGYEDRLAKRLTLSP